MPVTQVLGVLDLTFLDIKDDGDLDRAISEKLALLDESSSPTKKKKQASEIKALRLSNNMIESLDLILSGFRSLDCSKIQWLDLSFNNIRHVSVAFLAQFPNIKTINLHANKISRLSEIKKFATCSSLKSLSLYGNPVEEQKHYHNYVLYMCPDIHHFDMSPVTKSERQQTEVWSQTFRKKLSGNEDD